MPIPKIIHYCWFGNSELPDTVKKCIDSWIRFCPDYKIMLCNEQNYDVNKIPYMRDAYKNQKWAFVSDYARLDVVFHYGGFYLDTDVELIRSLDDLKEYDIFLAIERDCNIASGLGFGAVAKNSTIKTLMELYKDISFVNSDGTLNLKACTAYVTKWFEERGYEKKDQMQRVGETVILPSEYFCPLDYKTGKMFLTTNTYGIHWYNESWLSENDRKIHQKELEIQKILPSRIALLVCKLYRNSYRFIQYVKDGTINQQLHKKLMQK